MLIKHRLINTYASADGTSSPCHTVTELQCLELNSYAFSKKLWPRHEGKEIRKSLEGLLLFSLHLNRLAYMRREEGEEGWGDGGDCEVCRGAWDPEAELE